MDCGEQLGEDVLKPSGHAGRGKPETPGKKSSDFVDGDAAGEFSGSSPSHAITHRENEIRPLQGSHSGLSEVTQLVPIKIQCEECILIVSSESTDIGQS